MNVTDWTQPAGDHVERPQFTAVLFLKHFVSLSFGQIRSVLKRIAPQAALGDWDGPVTDAATDPGMEMLSLNGERMSVLVIDGPAPASVVRAGPFPNLLWPNAEKEAAGHKAHILIIGPEDPVDRDAALAKARAVTLLTGAIARIVPAIGVEWIDGANLVKAEAFIAMTEKIGHPDANAVPFWIRVALARGARTPTTGQALMAGTLGLRIFGLRELEYAPATLDPGFLLQHAYSVSEYLLRSGRRLGNGETIGVEGQSRFAVAHADKGDFGSFPVARLNLLSEPC